MEASWEGGPPEVSALVPPDGAHVRRKEVRQCPSFLGEVIVQDEFVPADGSDSPCELLQPAERSRLPSWRASAQASSLGRTGALALGSLLVASIICASRLQTPVPAGEGHHILQQALVRLWSNTCPADDTLVHELRQLPWPNSNKSKAPLVSKVIYINLKWDPVRRDYMESQLQSLSERWRTNVSLSWDRLEGVGASRLQKDKAYADWQSKGFSKAPFPEVDGDWAVAGCAYSHYSAIKQIPSNSEELVLIAEDDVEIMPNFPALWEELWRWMPDSWDVIRLGWFGDHQNCSKVVNSHIDLAAWQELPGSVCMYCGAQAYIVNPKSRDKVLGRFENSRITHADVLLSAPTPLSEDPAKVPPLKAFVAWPLLAQTHFGKNGFPAFLSDRIRGRGAVQRRSSKTTAEPQATSAPPRGESAAAKKPLKDRREQPTVAPGEDSSKVIISGPPQHQDGVPGEDRKSRLHGSEAATVSQVHLLAQLAAAKREALEARRKAEDIEAAAVAAQEAAKKAQEHARAKMGKLAAAAERRVKKAREAAETQAEKDSSEALIAAEEANTKVVEHLQAAEIARKQAEVKASQVERQASEALEQARQNASQATEWKKAEKEAEAAKIEASKRAERSAEMERQALRHALKADREREKMRGQAAEVLKALDAAEHARQEALEALQQETAARKKAEAKRKEAEMKLKEKDMPTLVPTLLPPLPRLGTLPPLATLRPLATLAPVATLPPPAPLGPQKLALLPGVDAAFRQAAGVVVKK